jgi:hypothetical protein
MILHHLPLSAAEREIKGGEVIQVDQRLCSN